MKQYQDPEEMLGEAILHWNFRVIAYLTAYPESFNRPPVLLYKVCEVYYQSNGGYTWVAEADAISGVESHSHLGQVLTWLQQAWEKPVLYHVLEADGTEYLTEAVPPAYEEALRQEEE